MFICNSVLTKEEIKKILKRLKTCKWNTGRTILDKKHKDNQEIVETDLSQMVAEKIHSHKTIMNNAFINQMTLPRFNKYKNKGHYSKHVDFFEQSGIRTDWSMTLFLTEPDTYDGGELVIEDIAHEPLKFKLEAGDMIIYPSGKPHYVTDVTRGERIAAIAWAESLIEGIEDRKLLGKLVDVMSKINDRDITVSLSYVYNNLLKRWRK